MDARLRAPSSLAEDLFAGQLSPAAAESVVRDSGARFLYSTATAARTSSRIVSGFTDPPRRFGCATVYRVK